MGTPGGHRDELVAEPREMPTEAQLPGGQLKTFLFGCRNK